ncbi:MAG: MFS transporter [Methanomicrobiales archaeon]|nr:MFS transporter [Methanomicrobiales archaeon]NYT21696.1 MFS transporter [Methanomicrobiales archaeon]
MYSEKAKRLVQIVAGLGSAIAPFMVSSLIVATPAIGDEFPADVALLGWITAAFFLTAAAFLVPFGRIADIRGSKRVFTAGMGVYLAAAVVCGLAPGILVLIAGRALSGLAAAMVFGTSLALLSLVFPEEEQGRAFGINITAMFAGFGLGLLAGGAITYYLSWRVIFAVVALVAAANIVLIRTRVRGECEISRTLDYDPVGMILFSPGVLFFMYGLAEIPAPTGIGALAAGSAALAGFFLWERRCPHSLIPQSLLRSRNLGRAVTANIIFTGSSFGIIFILSLYLQYVTGFDPRSAGLILLVSQAILIMVGPYSGRLSDRHPPHRIAAAGGAVNAVAMILLISLTDTTPLVLVIAALALNGIGIALFMPAVVKWSLRDVHREDTSLLTGISETARLTGNSLSNTVIIIIFSLVMGGATVTPETLPLFLAASRWTVIVYILMALASTLLAAVKVMKKNG